MSTFIALWIIGGLFSIGYLISSKEFSENTLNDNILRIGWVALTWPLYLGYRVHLHAHPDDTV